MAFLNKNAISRSGLCFASHQLRHFSKSGVSVGGSLESAHQTDFVGFNIAQYNRYLDIMNSTLQCLRDASLAPPLIHMVNTQFVVVIEQAKLDLLAMRENHKCTLKWKDEVISSMEKEIRGKSTQLLHAQGFSSVRGVVDILYENMKTSLEIRKISYTNRFDVYKKGLLLDEYSDLMKAFHAAVSDAPEPMTKPNESFALKLMEVHDKTSHLIHKYLFKETPVYIKGCHYLDLVHKCMVAAICNKLNVNHDYTQRCLV